jgi:hypothetical protein
MLMQVPPVVVMRLLEFDADNVIALREQMVTMSGVGHDSAILREDGRKWVPAMWEAVRGLVQAHAQPPPGPTA